jgi:hypothetical protein
MTHPPRSSRREDADEQVKAEPGLDKELLKDLDVRDGGDDVRGGSITYYGSQPYSAVCRNHNETFIQAHKSEEGVQPTLTA